ncbi:MAG TPA: sensor histidine kinase [Candidatus Sulfotelmatobacter sp.]|nr:sensor histidine kinase [Candidatus Sulfotelmatobacter sp.]
MAKRPKPAGAPAATSGGAGGRSGTAALRRELAEHQRVEAELRQTIAAQEQAFGRLTHRLKNNLQLVISILSLRLSAVRDDAARRAELEGVLGKIHAVALIQQKLQGGGRILTVDFADFLTELTAALRRPGARGMRVALEVAPVTLGIDRAMPLGLIANELIENAVGAAGDAPLAVRLSAHAGRVTLTVERTGLALPDAPGRADFGLPLVRALARQANAELAIAPDAVRLGFAADP